SFMRSPSMSRLPPVIGSSPAIILSSVDFPQPEGPTKTTNSPGATSRSMPCTTCISPYFLKTFCRTTLVDMLRNPLRQPTRIFRVVRHDGEPPLLAGLGRMRHRGDDVERPARIRAGHGQRPGAGEGIVEPCHLRRETRRDGFPVRQQVHDSLRGLVAARGDGP